MATWPVIADAKSYIGQPITSYDDNRLASVLAAAVQVVAEDSGLPVGADEVPANVIEGTLMLVSRLYNRRETPLGVQGFTGDQVAYIMRSDPDVQLLLQRSFVNWPIG